MQKYARTGLLGRGPDGGCIGQERLDHAAVAPKPLT